MSNAPIECFESWRKSSANKKCISDQNHLWTEKWFRTNTKSSAIVPFTNNPIQTLNFMKAIQEIEALMLDHLTKGDPEAYWKPETINFPGVSIAFEHGGDSNYPFIFQIFLTFSGISLHTHYHLGTGVTLCEEVKSLCVTLCEKIEERGAKRVREEFKGVRSI